MTDETPTTDPTPEEKPAKGGPIAQSQPSPLVLTHRCTSCGHADRITLAHFSVVGLAQPQEEKRLVTPADVVRMRRGP